MRCMYPLRRGFTRVFPVPGTSVCSVQHWYPYRHFCEFCTIFIPVPETSVSSVRPCHNTRGTRVQHSNTYPDLCEFCMTSIPYPELLWVMYDIHTRTRNVCKFCTPVPQYPGYGNNIRIPIRNFCEIRKTSIPIRTRNPQTLQNTSLKHCSPDDLVLIG